MALSLTKYKWRYLIFLSTIFLIIVASQVIIQFDIRQQLDDAKHINESGRQRMLSQRISKLVLYLEQDFETFGHATKSHLDSLNKYILQWQKVHYSLIQNEGRPNNPLIDSLLRENTVPLGNILDACLMILENPNEDNVNYAIRVISNNELSFLLRMEKIVNAYQHESERKLKFLKRAEFTLAGIAIIVLTFEFIWLFIPVINELRNSNEKLKSLNTALESQQEELSDKLKQINILNQKLEKSERTFREIVERAEDIIFEIDKEGKFQYLNPSSIKLINRLKINYNPGVSKIQDILHPETREEAIQFITAQIKNQVNNCYAEYELLEIDNKKIWLGINIQIEYENKSPKKIKMIARDITDTKNTEHYLKVAKENSEQLTEAKARFLSSMSHEIRTPMNAIIGLSNLILTEQPRPDQQENLRLIKFSAEHLLGIINDILDVSKIDSGKIELEKTSFNLKELCSQLVRSLSLTSKSKNLDVRFNMEDGVPEMVIGDKLRLSQVLTNLLGNAIKFTNDGFVELNVSKHEYDTKLCRFDVTDTGIGIDENKINLIFESFTQASADISRKYGGTGLGLAISKNLIEIMGGAINVKSTFGRGSTFSFYVELPASSDNSVKQEKLYDSPQAENYSKNLIDLTNINILVVEDNSTNQLVIKKFLQKWGANCEMAINGKQALDKIGDNKFDLVLMDIQMPDMDGYEAAKRLRSMKGSYFQDIPIIALTADVTAEVKQKVKQSGMNDIVTKPFEPSLLYQVIQWHIKNIEVKKSESELRKNIEVYADGDPAYSKELIGLLIANINELKDVFIKATEADNLSLLKSAIHKIKTTLEIIKAHDLHTLAKDFQTLCESGEAISEEEKHEYASKFKDLSDKWINSLKNLL